MGLTAGLTHGVSAGLASGIIVGLCGAVPAGLGYGIGSEIVGTPGPSRSQLRFQLRAPNPAALVVAAAGFGAVGAVIGGPLLGLALALTGAFVVVMWDLLESPADVQKFIDPSSTFGEDLRVVRVRGIVFWLGAAVVGLCIASPGDAIISGIGIGLTGGFISGLGTKAWGRFTVARTWLVATHRLPFRTTAFLEDAHQRGALRRVGAIYQFRHAALQTYLASRRRLLRDHGRHPDRNRAQHADDSGPHQLRKCHQTETPVTRHGLRISASRWSQRPDMPCALRTCA